MGKLFTFKEISDRLEDKFCSEEDKKLKCRYFQQRLTDGYASYKLGVDKDQEVYSFEEFAHAVLERHNRRYLAETAKFRQDYHINSNYLDSLIRQTTNKFKNMADTDYIFRRKNEDVADIDVLINQYYQLVEAEIVKHATVPLTHQLAQKALSKLAAGIDLISRGFIDEALIVWRSFLEDVTILKIITSHPDDQLETRFLVNKQDTLVDIGITPASGAHKDNLRDQTTTHLENKAGKEWEILRFSWVGSLIKAKDYSSGKLRDLAGLGEYNPHYKFTSVFVHERLVSDADVSRFSLRLIDYAIMLYWKLFDEVLRPQLETLFNLPKTLPLDKSEKEMRSYLKTQFGERFKELAGSII